MKRLFFHRDLEIGDLLVYWDRDIGSKEIYVMSLVVDVDSEFDQIWVSYVTLPVPERSVKYLDSGHRQVSSLKKQKCSKRQSIVHPNSSLGVTVYREGKVIYELDRQ